MFELGNTLREARQRRQIDLVIAEQDTKIRSKYLAALETEDFDVLPGPVFVRGFLRTYSFYLGLDAQMFIDEYNARFGRFEEAEGEHAAHSHVLGRPGLSSEHASRGRSAMRYAVVVTLVIVALFAWLGLRSDANDSGHRTASKHVDTPSTSDSTAATGATDVDMQDAVQAANEPATTQR